MLNIESNEPIAQPTLHLRHASVVHACRSCSPGKPLELLQLPFSGKDLFFVLVNPVFEAPTAEMRAVLPKEVCDCTYAWE